MDIVYNPFKSEHKSPVGGNLVNEEIKINIKITKRFNVFDLRLVYFNDDDNKLNRVSLNKIEDEKYNLYQTKISFEEIGLYWYYFEMDDCYGTHYIDCSYSLEGYLTDNHKNSFQLLIHDEFKGSLDWIKGKIIYQILVDRFNKGDYEYQKDYAIMHGNWNEIPNYKMVNGKIYNNDFFGGNLKGVIEKLPYLKELNVGAIYLNPIFDAYSNHKYDTGNYLEIDKMFGNDEIFKELCDRANELGIRIILDGVFNHTGSDSIYFNRYGRYNEVGAYQSKNSKYYDWYKFTHYPDKYACWWDFKTLPAVNQDNKGFRNFITQEVVKKWLKLGASGFRFYVVDELNDTFINELHDSIKNHNPNNILIGEVWEDASNKIAYSNRRHYFNGHQLDSVMNYPFKNAIIEYVLSKDVSYIKNTLRSIVNNYPKHVLDSLMNIISTHDTVRIITALNNVHLDNRDREAEYKIIDMDKAIKRLKMAITLQFTLPGVPTIYYGDEAGLEGYKDPFCRRTMPWGNFNEEIYSFYQRLTKIRKNKVYIDSEFKEIYALDGVYIFSRGDIYTIVNNSNFSFNFNICGFDLINDCEVDGVIIPKEEAMIVKGFLK